MKRTKNIIFLAIFCIAIISVGICFRDKTIAFAENTNVRKVSTIEDILGNKEIEKAGYLYNFDDSADYIYMDFLGESGYAIFADETYELLEYSMAGNFPYQVGKEKMYYGGPLKYFIKRNTQFLNTYTNEKFSISTEDAKNLANSTRSVFSLNAKSKIEKGSIDNNSIQNILSKNSLINEESMISNNIRTTLAPPLDESNLISPTSEATYISNKDYFLTNGEAPRHGANNGTSCTTIAIQLMLGFNNFYNDRRIIAPEHLFGGWKQNNNGDIFDPTNYVDSESSPNVCLDPRTMTSYTLGINQEHHDSLLQDGIRGNLFDTKNLLKSHLNSRGVEFDVCADKEIDIPDNDGAVEKEEILKTISPEKILFEINAGRPIVLETHSTLNGTQFSTRVVDHSVIAYGYQEFAAYADSGNLTTYLGYIVHMGYDPQGTGNQINVWTNSSWYYSYLSLEINHEHVYNVVTENIISGSFKELRCGECGHRIVDTLFTVDTLGNITGTKYVAMPDDIVIPTSINGQTIIGIKANAFDGCDFNSITIPSSVTNIELNAFNNCNSLVNINVDIDNTVYSSVDGVLFNKLGTTLIQYPIGKIGAYTIPINVTTIGTNAFYNCAGITEIIIPTNITLIGENAFYNCNGLTSIEVDLNNTIYKSEGNCLIRKSDNTLILGCNNSIIPSNVNTISANAFYGCAGLESVIITDNVNTIGENAFYGCDNLTIYTKKQSAPGGWHSNWNPSGRSVAWGCNLSNDGYVLIIGTINIGDGQTISNPYKLGDTFLGWYSSPYFYANSAAEENLLPNTVYYAKWNNLAKSITYDLAGGTGNYTSFSVNSGTQIEEPEHNPTKESMIFQYWAKSTDLTQEYDWESPVTEDITLMAVWEWDATEGLGYILNVDETGYEVSIGEASSTEIIIPNYHNGLPVIGIAENGFRKYTSITSITIPSNVEYIGYGAFEYCDALTSITFEVGSSLTEIDDWAFYSCDNLTSIELPNGLERIGRYAFGETGLISIEIPQSVTEIDDYAFYSCSSLENLTIQSNSELIRIGSYTFYGNAITSVNLPASVSSISGSSFANNDITDITVNDNNETYSSNGNCIIRNSDNVLILGCNESTIPDNVTSIGEYAFAYCDFISIAIPNTVVSIASYAFLGCTNLESIAIPSSVTSIGEDVFLWCSSLASINVDESNTVYSSEAGVLFNNTKTILIKYPTGKAGAYTVLNGVIEIGKNAFSYCAGLMSITIPSCVTTINNNAFRNCTTLTSITFEEGSLLNYIGNNAFWNCYAMECTTFGNNTVLSYIGSSSFEGCNGITSMTIPASITYIGSYAFSGWIETQTITFLTDISVIEDFDVDFLSYCNAVIDWESYLELETNGLEYTSATYIGTDDEEYEGYEVSIGTATSTTIVIPSMYNGSPVIRIAEDGFEGSEIVKVIIIGTNLKRIGESAFAGCEELIEINVPYSVEEIGSYAFSGCTNLTHINLPMEMDILDVGVFANSGIKSITMPSEVAIISPSALSGAYGYTIYTQDSYTQATWKGQFMTKDCVIFFETEIEYDNGAYVKSILIHVRNRMQAIPTEPYREGYEFVGWTTTEGSEAAEYTMEDLISIDLINGTRLYAVWQEIT